MRPLARARSAVEQAIRASARASNGYVKRKNPRTRTARAVLAVALLCVLTTGQGSSAGAKGKPKPPKPPKLPVTTTTAPALKSYSLKAVGNYNYTMEDGDVSVGEKGSIAFDGEVVQKIADVGLRVFGISGEVTVVGYAWSNVADEQCKTPEAGKILAQATYLPYNIDDLLRPRSQAHHSPAGTVGFSMSMPLVPPGSGVAVPCSHESEKKLTFDGIAATNAFNEVTQLLAFATDGETVHRRCSTPIWTCDIAFTLTRLKPAR
jgi:hypothetical protein